MMRNTLFMIVAAFILLIAYISTSYKRDIEWRDKRLAYYDSTYKSIGHWDSESGHVNYRSFDAGKTWYREVTDSVKCTTILEHITEKTDSVFRKMKGTEKLQEYVKQNGPIGNSGEITLKEIELLDAIGVTVVRKEDTE